MTNASSTFVTLMNSIFNKELDKSVISYLDDIILFIRMKEQHLLDLNKTLNTLRYNNLYAKPRKCNL